MKPRPLSPAIEYLRPFVPLFRAQEERLFEESRTNRDWHLGRKEYEAVPTLGGHEPAIEKLSIDNPAVKA